jgi:glycosyltransferase involved in cell wall biosynthesis
MTEKAMLGGKIAILVPAYNGGGLLRETVMSAARAGLPPDSYEILVSDNASTDGSAASLPACDIQGAPIIVRRNDSNIGRVANWNCALAAAEELGFSYAMFLMVGDGLAGRAVLDLHELMARRGAALGFASYQIVSETLVPLRIARRIHWHGDSGMPAGDFLAQSLAQGAMLYGPLGANLYRIDGPARLRFDVDDETHTDHLATALFALNANGPIIYLDLPVSTWRRRAGRFHNSMSIAERLTGDLRVIESACRASHLVPDYPKIRASMFLRATLFCRGDFRRAWRLARDIPKAAPMSWSWLFRLIARLLQNGTPWLVEA